MPYQFIADYREGWFDAPEHEPCLNNVFLNVGRVFGCTRRLNVPYQCISDCTEECLDAPEYETCLTNVFLHVGKSGWMRYNINRA